MNDGPNRLQKDGGDGREPLTAAAVAVRTGVRLIGNPEIVVRGVAPLDRANSDELSLLAHARYTSWFANTRAGVVLIAPQFELLPGATGARIVVEQPTDAMVGLLALFRRDEPRAAGVHSRAVVADSASLGAGVTIDAGAVIGDDVVIGDRSWIGANVSVGCGSRIGTDTRLHAGAVIYPWVEVGDRVVVHAGASIGREGFGFVPHGNAIVRIPHVGRCVLENDVEIGANSCVDRGSIDDTIIGAGTKVDNLVHIAHNVRIGRMCFLAAHIGIAGSARIEDGVQIGGQAGIGGHVTIGARASIGGQAGVLGNVPAGETWSGYPARPHREQMRAAAALAKIARLIRPIERMFSAREPS